MTHLSILLVIITGFSGGVVVGAGLVAFLIVLDIIPRLAQITKTQAFAHAYQWALIVGTIFWTWCGLRDVRFALPFDISMVYGAVAGAFVGMLAAALTEVLNVWPILAKRIGLAGRIVWLLMAMVLGKVIGSLFQWIFFTPLS